MAKLVQPPPKFVHSEWIHANKHLFANCEGERSAAERLILESCRTIDDTTQITKLVVEDSLKRLEQKISQTKHWEQELNISLEENKNDTTALILMETRISKMIETLREYLNICQQCLLQREKRMLIDLVHDNAEKELLKEAEVVQGSLAILIRTQQQTIEQIRLNRKIKYNLEGDLANKFSAISIDNHNAGLHPTSKCTDYNAGGAMVSDKSVSVEEWIDFTELNLTNAEKQRQNSVSVRHISDGIIQATYNDLLRQKTCTDEAIKYRIDETRDAKAKLEEHLNKIQRQIIEMEDNILRLEHSLGSPITKTGALKMTHSRLENRMNRPGNELCRDLAQFSLIETDEALRKAIADLQHQIAMSHESLKALDRKKLELEREIKVKTESLFIDETECMTMRSSICLHCY